MAPEAVLADLHILGKLWSVEVIDHTDLIEEKDIPYESKEILFTILSGSQKKKLS